MSDEDQENMLPSLEGIPYEIWQDPPNMVDIRHLTDGIVHRLNEVELERARKEPRRTYLGLSGIGRKCDRQIWYDFRWASPRQFDPRHLRRAQTGHVWEARTIEALKTSGIEFYDPPDGHQFEVSLFGGLIAGHFDGLCLGVPEAPKSPHLFEHKAIVSCRYEWDDEYTEPYGPKREFNWKFPGKFWRLMRDGVEVAIPTFYAQLQAYMGTMRAKGPTGKPFWQEFGLPKAPDRAWFVAVNTDVDIYYDERIYYRPKFARALVKRAMDIVNSSRPPERYSENPNDWECKFCEHRETCHAGAEFVKSCRTCLFAEVSTDSEQWRCGLTAVRLQEFKPCHRWEPTHAEQENASR